MQIYKVIIEKTKYGYCVTQPDFDIAIDADTLEHAISSIQNVVEQQGVLKLTKGEEIPQSTDDGLLPDSNNTVYIQVDIYKKFKNSASEAVRKNISMPAWMDMQLRYYDIDASKLFQEAANAILEQKRANPKAVYKPITNVSELIEAVPEDVLKEYLVTRLFR